LYPLKKLLKEFMKWWDQNFQWPYSYIIFCCRNISNRMCFYFENWEMQYNVIKEIIPFVSQFLCSVKTNFSLFWNSNVFNRWFLCFQFTSNKCEESSQHDKTNFFWFNLRSTPIVEIISQISITYHFHQLVMKKTKNRSIWIQYQVRTWDPLRKFDFPWYPNN
jgi:hypothetical protein